MSPPDSPRENVFPMTSSILISFYLSFSYQIYRVIVNNIFKLWVQSPELTKKCIFLVKLIRLPNFDREIKAQRNKLNDVLFKNP